MKKLFLLLLCFMISSNSIFANEISARNGWGVAAADAAGALGGAGSVASIAGWFSWTPAAPVAAIACGVGALIGGAGASMAASKTNGATPKNPKDILTNEVAFPDNYFDQVGVIHNQILFDYFSENSIYEPKKYFDYMNLNKSKYGIKEVYVTLEYLERQYQDSKSFNDIDAINSYTLQNLPQGVDKSAYSKFLNDLSNIEEKKAAIAFIKNFERTELKNPKYSEKTLGILGSFFSTYRYSIALWY